MHKNKEKRLKIASVKKIKKPLKRELTGNESLKSKKITAFGKLADTNLSNTHFQSSPLHFAKRSAKLILRDPSPRAASPHC